MGFLLVLVKDAVAGAVEFQIRDIKLGLFKCLSEAVALEYWDR